MTDPLRGVEWRLIGPYRGGRVVAVAGDWAHPRIFYFGSTGGGVWKTTDGGIYWQNVSDGFFQRASVGAIAVAASDPNVIYVGMGESTIRGNVSHGDGVYRSTDAGKTWKHLGLADTRHIGKVRVHPTNPDIAYVAALGHAHGPNRERGVYRTRDGGATWDQVLFRSEDAGAVDLSMDPNNPRIIYASTWEARRNFWSLTSGGPGSGLWKTIDGGDTWTELSHNRGLPKGVLGKIGVAVSGARPDRVFAIVEAEDGAVFRSDDAGESWQKLSDDRQLRERAWYYNHTIADPRDPETVWVLNTDTWKSNDGGQTFSTFAIPHGDNHDLWIDPNDTLRMIEGNDGGATVTFDGGASWSSLYNQPTAEFYHVTTDVRTPYRVYGAQQDNTTITVPSRSPLVAITNTQSFDIGGGESGYIAVRPDDPDIVFAGSYQGYLTRYDHRTGQMRSIEVWPDTTLGAGATEAKYRFQWTYPILLSPHDPNVLYVTGNHVFRSFDEGQTWNMISPDLTRNDPTKLGSSGGPLTQDNTGAEYYCTIFAFAESPVQRGVLWAGSDDGLIHISRDNGESWQNVTPPDLPEWTLISIIEPSPHDPSTAYVAATRYKLDDFAPYLFKTNDYGSSWTRIDAGLPENVFCRAIRVDPKQPGLIYAGLETGVWVSYDDGGSWHELKGNLPTVPIHDLVVREPQGDLVLATHGRSFWILDDLSPVRQLGDAGADVALVKPRTAVRYLSNGGFAHRAVPGNNYRMPGATMVTYRQVEDPRTGEKVTEYVDSAKNPPDGAIISYFLPSKPEDDITLTLLYPDGTEIRSFSSHEPESEEEKKKQHDPRIPKEEGLNRFVWNLRYPDAVRIEDDDAANELVEEGIHGPVVAPGSYRVRLRVGDQTFEEPFDVAADPRIAASTQDLRAQFELLLRIREKVSETHTGINRLRALRRRAEDFVKRAREAGGQQALESAAQAVVDALKPIEEQLMQPQAKTRADTLNVPVRLNGKLASLVGVINSADTVPTASSVAVFHELSERVDAQLAALRSVIDNQVAELNNAIRQANLEPVGA